MADEVTTPKKTKLSDADEKTVEDWFREFMSNSVVSQNTEIYNHVRKAVDELKARLAAAKKG